MSTAPFGRIPIRATNHGEEKVLSRRKRDLVISTQGIKALVTAVQLDQLLYEALIRQSDYTSSQIIVDFLEDFFVYSLAKRLSLMFIPLDNDRLPEAIGK